MRSLVAPLLEPLQWFLWDPHLPGTGRPSSPLRLSLELFWGSGKSSLGASSLPTPSGGFAPQCSPKNRSCTPPPPPLKPGWAGLEATLLRFHSHQPRSPPPQPPLLLFHPPSPSPAPPGSLLPHFLPYPSPSFSHPSPVPPSLLSPPCPPIPGPSLLSFPLSVPPQHLHVIINQTHEPLIPFVVHSALSLSGTPPQHVKSPRTAVFAHLVY